MRNLEWRIKTNLAFACIFFCEHLSGVVTVEFVANKWNNFNYLYRINIYYAIQLLMSSSFFIFFATCGIEQNIIVFNNIFLWNSTIQNNLFIQNISRVKCYLLKRNNLRINNISAPLTRSSWLAHICIHNKPIYTALNYSMTILTRQPSVHCREWLLRPYRAIGHE